MLTNLMLVKERLKYKSNRFLCNRPSKEPLKPNTAFIISKSSKKWSHPQKGTPRLK